MSLIAELRISGESFALGEALAAAPGMRVETEYSVPAPAGPIVFVWAWGGEFEPFEASLPEDPTVQEFDLIEGGGDRRLYEIVLDDGPALIDPAPLHRQTSASQLRMVTLANCAIITERLPDRDSLSEYIRLCREHGYEVELLRAYPADDQHGRYDLSEKQAAALRAALDAGYFETPRKTDLGTLAAAFDISEQALSERLRRGVAAVLESTVGELEGNARHGAGIDAEAVDQSESDLLSN
ncbi:helix-turn-helix domain-containing protein [Halolamina salifodinae]|uniref:Putative DNA binding protein n=1 Tax=Halolamina salifodinae TaxID=1202767 RepID=A0A8T4GVW0_9EURY|nr:helix-turn-helix domain-containing protein [Halolamina salifodinae]MBP1986252.1 putative DNA binding protein [Halolamina salifodinae]